MGPLAPLVGSLESVLALTVGALLVMGHPSRSAARLYLVYATQGDYEPIQTLCELSAHEFEGLGDRREFLEEESCL